MFLLLLVYATAVSASLLRTGTGVSPCCETCTVPLQKYISVDHGIGHPPFCGETCLLPSKYNIYHLFERNLTKADNASHPCAHEYAPDGRTYSHYNSTVTHGWPGILSVTLDLYAPA